MQKNQLHAYARPAEVCENMADGRIRCLACAHKCGIPRGGRGICGVRFNDNGVLKAPWGYVSALGLDPIEKKPFFHARPGALTFSFGMLGCNFKCSFCQNHEISQVHADSSGSGCHIEAATPEKIALSARDAGAEFIISTYNEPLITVEWSIAVFKEAKKYGIRGAYVSNGYASPEVLGYIKPYVDLYKADLKTFNEDNYLKTAGGRLSKVLKALEIIHAKGFWLEIVTLLIPGFNDGAEELNAMAGFIAGLSRDIPWHVTAFYPAYNMTDRRATPPETLSRAREIGLKKGIRYVYTGNIPGEGCEDTICHSCAKLLVRRRGFKVLANFVKTSPGGKGICPSCGAPIPGIWM